MRSITPSSASSRPRLATVALAAMLAGLIPTATGGAQEIPLPRPAQAWRTVESRHFVFHYPAPMREWTMSIAPRMDDIHRAVGLMVGFVPPRKVHVVVDDPLAESNGSAWPIVPAPIIYLWPTPPEPTSAIGNNRAWGEILGVHEFAHIAHLVRPSRQRLWGIRTPFGRVGLSPMPVKTPRWMIEGYATFVEGRLTGHGRPRGVWRPAILRQWAREGRMPSYEGLNGSDGFYGGSLAYLAGSAYIEWLAARKGDSSLVHVWRRMTAKVERSFDEAFVGVYGASPSVLYGRFVAELTENAMDAEELLGGADSAAAGVTEQRFTWYTGEPAISPDGKLVALPVAERMAPTRVVVLPTAPDTMTGRERQRRARILERDPQDVLAVPSGPRPRRAVATLWPRKGSAFSRPRWFRDNERLLLVHRDGRPDGSFLYDLYEWNRRSGRTRRLTHGANIRSADPSPDGRTAAGVRCVAGSCGLVVVDLATGAVRERVAGSPTVTWYKPRWSPDGRTIAASAQRDGTWRVYTMDATGGEPAEVLPGEARVNRYDATWTPDGRALVMVSEASGVPQLERVELASRTTTPLTRVLGAATAPEVEPSGRGVWFLSLYSRGMDLKRVVPESTTAGALARLDTALAPAVSMGVTRADTFATSPLSAERAYGTGPRRHLLLPFNLYAVEGNVIGLTLAGTDPVGRLTYTLSGGWNLAEYREGDTGLRGAFNRVYAGEGMWRGGALRAEWRGMRPVLEGEAWWTEHRPGEQHVGAPFITRALAGLDHRQYCARAGARLERSFGWRTHTYRAGLVYSMVDPSRPGSDEEARRLAYAELGGAYRFTRRRSFAAARWRATGTGGTTFDADWQRVLLGAGLSLGGSGGSLSLDASWGRAYDAPGFEAFAVGGIVPPFFDASVMSQRIAAPGLPAGLLRGSRVATWRVSLGGDLIEPYLMGFAAGERLPGLGNGDFYDRYYKIVGAESVVRLPNIPLVRAPGVQAQIGVSYSLDDPLKDRLRAYGGLTYRP